METQRLIQSGNYVEPYVQGSESSTGGGGAGETATDSLESQSQSQSQSQRGKLEFNPSPSAASSRNETLVASVLDDMKTDLLSFLNEYFMWCYPLQTPYIQQHSAEITHLIESYDVVVFGKVGCGYCERAKKALAIQQRESPFPFSITVLDAEGDVNRSSMSASALKTAIILKTAIFDLTFPQIVVKGTYVGGSDDLQSLIDAGLFKPLIANPERGPSSKQLQWEPSLLQRSRKPDLLTVPTMPDTWYPHTPFYGFQFVMYANLLRYISIMQICFMLGIGALFKAGGDNNSKIGSIILYVFMYDLSALVIFGPAPFSITGTLAQYFFWRVRGNATSLLPYKFIFGFYLLVFMQLLLKRVNSSDNKFDTLAEAAVLGLVLNSALLAAFRF